MEPTLQASLAAIITKATDGITEGINFLSVQIPDVLHQLLVYKFTVSLVENILSGIFILTMGIIAFLTYKIAVKAIDRTEGFSLFLWIISLLFTVLPSILCSRFNLVWLQIWLSPKLYLIEYAASLVKGH